MSPLQCFYKLNSFLHKFHKYIRRVCHSIQIVTVLCGGSASLVYASWNYDPWYSSLTLYLSLLSGKSSSIGFVRKCLIMFLTVLKHYKRRTHHWSIKLCRPTTTNVLWIRNCAQNCVRAAGGCSGRRTDAACARAGLRLKLVGLVQRSAATWRRFCIHRVNRVNSRSGSATTTALSSLLLLLLLLPDFFLREMTSWPPSWKYDVMSEIRFIFTWGTIRPNFVQSALKGGALGFLERMPQKENNRKKNTTTTTTTTTKCQNE